MKISGTHYRTIWPTAAGSVRVIDQSRLPFEFATVDLDTLDDAVHAIRTMVVRGAPLIGATAAYGMALALRSNASDAASRRSGTNTAGYASDGSELSLGIDQNARMRLPQSRRRSAPRRRFEKPLRSVRPTSNNAVQSAAMALRSSRRFAKTAGRTVNILTHCNAGWLACVDWGTALSPIYMAHDAGIPRPRVGGRNPAT